MQSQINDHLPCYCSLYYVVCTLDAWHGVWIFVCSKDAQKQLAWTSLNFIEKKLTDVALRRFEVTLSSGQMALQVVASTASCKLNLHRDLHWVAKRTCVYLRPHFAKALLLSENQEVHLIFHYARKGFQQENNLPLNQTRLLCLSFLYK